MPHLPYIYSVNRWRTVENPNSYGRRSTHIVWILTQLLQYTFNLTSKQKFSGSSTHCLQYITQIVWDRKKKTTNLKNSDHVSILGRLREVNIRIIGISPPHIFVQLIRLLPTRGRHYIHLHTRVPILNQLYGRKEEQVLINATRNHTTTTSNISSHFQGQWGYLHTIPHWKLEETIRIIWVIGWPGVLLLFAIGEEWSILHIGVFSIIKRVQPGIFLFGSGIELNAATGFCGWRQGLWRGEEGRFGEVDWKRWRWVCEERWNGVGEKIRCGHGGAGGASLCGWVEFGRCWQEKQTSGLECVEDGWIRATNCVIVLTAPTFW